MKKSRKYLKVWEFATAFQSYRILNKTGNSWLLIYSARALIVAAVAVFQAENLAFNYKTMKKRSGIKATLLLTAACLAILILLAGFGSNVSKAGKKPEKQSTDTGKQPFVLDIEKATIGNKNYREVRWTGQHLQMVLMSVKPGEEIDLEMHQNVDQFLRIEQGQAQVLMGKTKQKMSFNKTVSDDWAILIPAGYYHQIKNTGKTDLKLYSIYAPANHPAGTIHKTYQEARKAHEKH